MKTTPESDMHLLREKSPELRSFLAKWWKEKKVSIKR